MLDRRQVSPKLPPFQAILLQLTAQLRLQRLRSFGPGTEFDCVLLPLSGESANAKKPTDERARDKTDDNSQQYAGHIHCATLSVI
ncbi:hypothetical protein NITLEN_10940 [Nitrospira lenta]|uniref:Uncharacterized protein n=1 Tax=Nitrospira lenta TaxID=1436998 RepID=A0A330L2I6_9BACT|nr:hypothetical protein NITLEN_10940 [Nitrospira lenta]